MFTYKSFNCNKISRWFDYYNISLIIHTRIYIHNFFSKYGKTAHVACFLAEWSKGDRLVLMYIWQCCRKSDWCCKWNSYRERVVLLLSEWVSVVWVETEEWHVGIEFKRREVCEKKRNKQTVVDLVEKALRSTHSMRESGGHGRFRGWSGGRH